MESPSSKRRRISVAAIRNSGPRGGRSRPQRTRQAADGSAGGSSSSSTPKATGLSNIRQKILTQLLTLLHKDQHSASARALPGSPAASAAGAGTTPSPPPPPPPSDAAEGGGTGGGGGVSSEEGDGDGDGDSDSDDEFGFLPLPAIHDLPDDDKQTATDLAAEIESCGHDLHHAKGKYKQRMQSIIFNLQRYKGLRTRVLSGEMEPRQLCAASSAEMQMHSTSKSEASMLARILSAGASKATLPSGSLTVKVDKKEGGTKMEWFAGKDDDDDENAHERAMGRHVAAELPPGAHEAEAEAAGAKSSPGWGRRKASAAAGRGGDEGGDAHSSGSGDDSPRRRASQTAGAIHSGRDVRRDWDSDQAHAHAHGGPTRADAAQAAWKSNQFSANVSRHLVTDEAPTGPSAKDILRAMSAGRRSATEAFRKQQEAKAADLATQPQGTYKDGRLCKQAVVAFAKPLLMAAHRKRQLDKGKFKAILRAVVQTIVQRNKHYDKKIVSKLIAAHLA